MPKQKVVLTKEELVALFNNICADKNIAVITKGNTLTWTFTEKDLPPAIIVYARPYEQ